MCAIIHGFLADATRPLHVRHPTFLTPCTHDENRHPEWDGGSLGGNELALHAVTAAR